MTVQLRTSLIDKETRKIYHSGELLSFETLEKALDFISKLQTKMEMQFTTVKYTIICK